MQTAFKITHHNDNNKELIDEISLSYEERFVRRKKLLPYGCYFVIKTRWIAYLSAFIDEGNTSISSTSTHLVTGLGLHHYCSRSIFHLGI